MVDIEAEAPLKVLVEDFKKFQKLGTTWNYKITETHTLINVSKILIQGRIIKTAGLEKEILLIYDGTAKVKVTRKAHVPGDLSWLSDGVCCSVVGTLLENGKLPSLSADKIAKITNSVLEEMWPWEVKELRNFLMKKFVLNNTSSNEF